MTKTSTILGVIFLGLFFALPVLADESLFFDTHIGYYCSEVQDFSYLSGGHYSVDGFCHSYYTGTGLPAESTGYYGDIYEKTSGTTATLLNGHALSGSSSGNFISSQNDYFNLATTSKIYFVAIYNYTKCVSGHPSQSLRNYLSDTQYYPAPADDCEWGILLWTDKPVWTGEWNFMLPPVATTTEDFGIIGNYFKDLFIWLFKPQQASLEQFKNLKIIMESKAPFAYFITIKNSLAGLSGTSTPAFSLATSSAVVNTFFNPIKTGLAWILWIVFAFWAIRKISNFNF